MQKFVVLFLLYAISLGCTTPVCAQKPLDNGLVGKINAYPLSKWSDNADEQKFLTSIEKISRSEAIQRLKERFSKVVPTGLLYIARVQYDPQFRVSEEERLQRIERVSRAIRFQRSVVNLYKTFDAERVARIPLNIRDTWEGGVPVTWVGKTRRAANQTFRELWQQKKELPVGAMWLATTFMANSANHTSTGRELVAFVGGLKFMDHYDRARANSWRGSVPLQLVPQTRRKTLDAALSELYMSLGRVPMGGKPAPEKQAEMDFIYPLIMELRK